MHHTKNSTISHASELISTQPLNCIAENLASIERRAVIKEVMQKQGDSWTHYPQFDARRNALDQHLP